MWVPDTLQHGKLSVMQWSRGWMWFGGGGHSYPGTVGSTGPYAGQEPCSRRPDTAARNTGRSRSGRCSWCRRWTSTNPRPGGSLRCWRRSIPVGCCWRGGAARVCPLRAETQNMTMIHCSDHMRPQVRAFKWDVRDGRRTHVFRALRFASPQLLYWE